MSPLPVTNISAPTTTATSSMHDCFDDIPTSTSLLMQCGYRSKVCTNHRATKVNGTLHKLCELHRRKANLNQQRLHKRQREKRARLQEQEESEDRPVKKTRPIIESNIHPIDWFRAPSESYKHYTPLVSSSDFAFSKLREMDMDILEMLLVDMQPQMQPPLETFLPCVSAVNDAKTPSPQESSLYSTKT